MGLADVPVHQKGRLTMYLWICWFRNDDDWGCYVIAPTRGRAKSLFFKHFNDQWFYVQWYTDVRSQKVKEAQGQQEGIYDVDGPVLEALGVRYRTEA